MPLEGRCGMLKSMESRGWRFGFAKVLAGIRGILEGDGEKYEEAV